MSTLPLTAPAITADVAVILPITTVPCPILAEPLDCISPEIFALLANTSLAIIAPSIVPLTVSFPQQATLPSTVPNTSIEPTESKSPLTTRPAVITAVSSAICSNSDLGSSCATLSLNVSIASLSLLSSASSLSVIDSLLSEPVSSLFIPAANLARSLSSNVLTIISSLTSFPSLLNTSLELSSDLLPNNPILILH